MNMSNKTELKIIDFLKTNYISTREAAQLIINFLIKEKIERLNFAEIDFVSRSFAHQLKSDLKKNKSLVEFVNLSVPIQKMFLAIENSPRERSSLLDNNVPSDDATSWQA